MRIGIARVLIVAVAGVWLAGCSTSKGISDLFESKTSESKTSESKTLGTDAYASAPSNADGDTSASVTPAAAPGLLGMPSLLPDRLDVHRHVDDVREHSLFVEARMLTATHGGWRW